ncbi:MAG: hypothetical protein GXO26_08290 [Crenarchaeota archaeon]|nr:hypothetical protein [Thermoproteota archaeon]
MDEYLIKRNANIPPTAVSILVGLEERCLWENHILPTIAKINDKWYRYEITGTLYTFKIRSGGWMEPYCGGFNATEIGKRELIETTCLTYRCAKYGTVFMNHVLDIALYLTQERTGAVGLNYLDIAAAPYITDDRELRQMVEFYHYNVNKPSRYVSQSMFINEIYGISMGEKPLKELEVYKCGKKIGTGIEMIDNAVKYMGETIRSFMRGDAHGRPLTFPIPSVYLTDFFLKILREHDLWEMFWELIARRGTFYFMNPNVSEPGEALSFCCRLRIDVQEILKHVPVTGRWVILTGSIGYIGINMPRLAWLSRGEPEKIIPMLDDILETCRNALMYLKRRYLDFYKMGLYPTTAWLLNDPYRLSNPFRTYFNTVATIGIAEYMSIMYLLNHDDSETMKLARTGLPEINSIPFYSAWNIPDRNVKKEMVYYAVKVLEHVKKRLREFAEADQVLYNLEQAPAEEASIKLAMMDAEYHPKMLMFIPRDVDPETGRIELYYSSQTVPYYSIYPLEEKVWIENELCRPRFMNKPLYDGGYVMFIHAPMYLEAEKVAKLVTEICRSTYIPYIAYKPVQSICRNCWTVLTGIYDECPNCGSRNIEKWDRIVGYYRPISNWNPGRRAEFMSRRRKTVLS